MRCLSSYKRLQNTKYTGPEKKGPSAHNDQNNKCTEQKKNVKSFEGKEQVTYEGWPIRITPDILMETPQARSA